MTSPPLREDPLSLDWSPKSPELVQLRLALDQIDLFYRGICCERLSLSKEQKILRNGCLTEVSLAIEFCYTSEYTKMKNLEKTMKNKKFQNFPNLQNMSSSVEKKHLKDLQCRDYTLQRFRDTFELGIPFVAKS